jgi:hypothetical protein
MVEKESQKRYFRKKKKRGGREERTKMNRNPLPKLE